MRPSRGAAAKATPEKEAKQQEPAEATQPPQEEGAEANAGDAKPEAAGKKKAAGKKEAKENGVTTTTTTEEKADKKDGATEEKKEGEEKAKAKPVKRSVPSWADLPKGASSSSSQRTQSAVGPTGMVAVIEDAVRQCADAKGHASAIHLKRHVLKTMPHWPKVTFKSALKKALEKKRVVQVRGKGMAGSFKLGKPEKEPAKADSKAKKAKATVPLDDLLPNIFTWVCEPKEASGQLIRKYLAKHHQSLDVEGKAFAKALDNGVLKGQLDRITGKTGVTGTFQLVDGAKKMGSKYEDAIEDAVIAMNEPKDASVQALRHYLSEYHTEYNVKDRPKVLKKALDRCEAKGWISRVTGKGFSGTFRLAFPYHPGPRELWGEWYQEEKKAEKKARKRTYDETVEESSDDEEEEDSDDDTLDSDDEVLPAKKQRGTPQARKSSSAKRPPIKKATPKKKKMVVAAAKKVTPKKTTSAAAVVFAKKSKLAGSKKQNKPAAAGKRSNRAK